jgi:hypothetical protein
MIAADIADVRPGVLETPEEMEKKKNFSHDSFWKDLIERFFYSLLKRALPELYEDTDRETRSAVSRQGVQGRSEHR